MRAKTKSRRVLYGGGGDSATRTASLRSAAYGQQTMRLLMWTLPGVTRWARITPAMESSFTYICIEGERHYAPRSRFCLHSNEEHSRARAGATTCLLRAESPLGKAAVRGRNDCKTGKNFFFFFFKKEANLLQNSCRFGRHSAHIRPVWRTLTAIWVFWDLAQIVSVVMMPSRLGRKTVSVSVLVRRQVSLPYSWLTWISCNVSIYGTLLVFLFYFILFPERWT